MVSAALIVDCAQNVCNEMLGTLHTQVTVVSIRNKLLTISSTSPTILGELRLQESIIKRRVNGEIGGQQIDRIRFLCSVSE